MSGFPMRTGVETQSPGDDRGRDWSDMSAGQGCLGLLASTKYATGRDREGLLP